MEDAHLADVNLGNGVACFGVFDGHGGKEVAIFVAENFSKNLIKHKEFASNLEQAVIDSFLKMDELFMTKEGKKELSRIQKDLPLGSAISDRDSEDLLSIAGCTSVVALVKEKELICANAGDSRCVLAKNGRAIEMSRDHKPDLEQEKQRIHKAGGTVEVGRVNGNLNLSRSIGDLEYK